MGLRPSESIKPRLSLIKLLAAQVEVERKEIMVLPGENVTFMCRVGVPLQYCRIEIPGLRTYNLNKGSIDKDVSYYGEGLEAGQCGFRINQVQDKNNGNIKCSLGLFSEATESIGNMQLVVANDDLVNDNGLKMPTVIDLAKENLQSKLQNMTRTLQATDNGKYLRCVAYHPAYPRGYAETKRQLDIKFAPLPIYEPTDKFGYQIGRVGLINLTIEANPKPQIEWTVGGQKGRGKYLVNLRIAAINKHDTENDYILTAYNDLGSQDYRIKISTSPEPEGKC
ncbi:hypothetical protein NQ314_003907 [Rhamnusium bicolor]|uniref:Uncharacterized protein n=1 Tax=Rhamnusium bicolor TaxID=1586634 RepID=A0AAV8ZNA0_9CUCU|nr:hypothetical protein NQ314_003907 [Rhamnusium bicolor]